jgi:hypothetical protein
MPLKDAIEKKRFNSFNDGVWLFEQELFNNTVCMFRRENFAENGASS